jgi:hypothetical protein
MVGSLVAECAEMESGPETAAISACASSALKATVVIAELDDPIRGIRAPVLRACEACA